MCCHEFKHTGLCSASVILTIIFCNKANFSFYLFFSVLSGLELLSVISYFKTQTFQQRSSSHRMCGKNSRYFSGTLKSRDDSKNMQVIRVALPQTAVASLPAGQHCPVRLDHKGAVLTTHHLQAERCRQSGQTADK